MELAPKKILALETAVTLAIRAKLARADREYLQTGSRQAQGAAYWCECRLVERRRAGLGLGWWTL